MKWLLRQAFALLLACLAVRTAIDLITPVVPFLLLAAIVLTSTYWFIRTR